MNRPVVVLFLALVATVHSQPECCRELSQQLTALKDVLALLQAENNAQALRLDTLEAGRIGGGFGNQAAQQVVFSASLVVGGPTAVGRQINPTTLVFKKVRTNVGEAYDPLTGVFTAPVKGYYVFHWHIAAPGSKLGTAVTLYKSSGATLNEETFRASHRMQEGMGSMSQTIALSMEVGDTVFLVLWQGGVVFDSSANLTTFSGHLLFTV